MNTALEMELRLFLGSPALGALLGLLYDLFRTARHGMGRLLGWLWDGLYLLLAALALFALSLRFGETARGVTVLLAAAGGGLYALLLSPYVRSGISAACAWLAYPLRMLEKPLKNVEEIAKKLFAKLQKWFTITETKRKLRRKQAKTGEGKTDADTEDHLEYIAVAGGGIRVCYAAERIGRYPFCPGGADAAAAEGRAAGAGKCRASVYDNGAERGQTENAGA